jgi:hypothetical protein
MNAQQLPAYMKWAVTTVGIPQRSWRWGRRCEIRIHRADVDPRGRGYMDRCHDVWGDYDSRHEGPRSEYGRAWDDACQVAAQRTLQEVNDHRHMWE